MQISNSPSAEQFPAIVAALHDDRIERYLPAAGGSMEYAFRLYLWNCLICEAFYAPLHFAEVALRNAIHHRLLDRLGEQWFENATLHRILDDRARTLLFDAVSQERKARGLLTTGHHVVSALSFGFWPHMLTKRYDRLFWNDGLREAFPNLPNTKNREDVFNLVDSLRHWRNRIAHHRAVFDHSPSTHYNDVMLLVRWISHDMADWLASVGKVSQAIALRPAP